MSRKIELKDMLFGSLRVIEYACTRNGKAMWICECSCGNRIHVIGSNLTRGNSTKCIECRAASYRTDKISRTPEYRAWNDMKTRCFNRNFVGYKDYGARGITVCERWKDSFELFLKDMGHKPSPMHSLDRINYDGNYEPGNCRWATRREQARNKRNATKIVDLDGETRPLVELSEKYQLQPGTIYKRLQLGWSIEKALLMPVRNSK